MGTTSKKAKIAILTRPDDASPKILSQSLQEMIQDCGGECDIFYEISMLMRLLPLFGENKQKGKIHFVLRRKARFFFRDLQTLNALKKYDAIVISDCEPNGFWKDLFNVEKLRSILQKPIIFHEVYYLGNLPSHIQTLKEGNHPTMERYDWHLAVTDTTEIKSKPQAPWSRVGLNLKQSGLVPKEKDSFFAIVDFVQKGYEKYREDQVRALEELGIPYLSFTERMPMKKIREHYQNASLMFLEFPETFGVPIAECFSAGTAIFTPCSSWPMSWRLDENPQMHQEGKLPDCFYVYQDYEDLKKQLKDFQTQFHKTNTPKAINQSFMDNYPHFHHGDLESVNDFLNRVKERDFA